LLREIPGSTLARRPGMTEAKTADSGLATPPHPGMARAVLDKHHARHYVFTMSLVRRTLDIDAGTDARLAEIAAERGQDVASVLADAVALLDSVIDLAGPDLAEDRRRLDAFRSSGEAVPLDDVKAWVASWGSADERPPPPPRKTR
jgi:predicted transcriptional regulator